MADTNLFANDEEKQSSLVDRIFTAKRKDKVDINFIALGIYQSCRPS